MNAQTFSAELLVAFNERPDLFRRVVLQNESPIADGRAYISDDRFLSFYFNERTGTTAFALIDRNERIWGIDRKKRGWHLRPLGKPQEHRDVEPVTIGEIIGLLARVLLAEG
jgi:hypothetical protein